MPDLSVVDRLSRLAFALAFPTRYRRGNIDPDRYERVETLVGTWYAAADAGERRRLRQVRKDVSDPLAANPGWLAADLALGLAWSLVHDVNRTLDEPVPAADLDPGPDVTPGLRAALRMALGAPRAGDDRTVRRFIEGMRSQAKDPPPAVAKPPPDKPPRGGDDNEERPGPDGGGAMPDCTIDRKGLPATFDSTSYQAAIDALFKDRHCDPDGDASQRAHACYVTGRLIGESYLDPRAPGFEEAFVDAFNEGFEKSLVQDDTKAPFKSAAKPGGDGRKYVTNVVVYGAVTKRIGVIKGRGSSATAQEITAVSDHVISLPPVDDNFNAKVDAGFQDHVARAPSFDTLNLPEIVTTDTAASEIEPANVRAVAMIYAVREIETTGLLDAVEAMVEDWMEGVVPVGENAGRLFDTYVFEGDERLDTSARKIQTQRVEGVHQGLLRVCAGVSEHERRQFLGEFLANRDRVAARTQTEHVRKAMRELLADASLRGWAYAQFAAKRLANQVRDAVAIIEHPEVQKAYGVREPWQVVERSRQMRGLPPAQIVKGRTSAAASKAILDQLADKAQAIGASAAQSPLFPDRRTNGNGNGGVIVGGGGRSSVFSETEYETLLLNVDNWIAVNGIDDSQVIDHAQPRDTQMAPSLPNFGGGGLAGMGDGSLDQLRQMVSQGQAPSLDQLRQLLPNFGF